jgi:hypothetical protein
MLWRVSNRLSASTTHARSAATSSSNLAMSGAGPVGVAVWHGNGSLGFDAGLHTGVPTKIFSVCLEGMQSNGRETLFGADVSKAWIDLCKSCGSPMRRTRW